MSPAISVTIGIVALVVAILAALEIRLTARTLTATKSYIQSLRNLNEANQRLIDAYRKLIDNLYVRRGACNECRERDARTASPEILEAILAAEAEYYANGGAR